MMTVAIYSIPMSKEERATWPSDDEICPRCGQSFNCDKKLRLKDAEKLEDRTVIHKKCAHRHELP